MPETRPGRVLTLLLTFVYCAIGGQVLGAQSLEWGGYGEHQVYPQGLRGKVVAMDYSKIRFDANTDLTSWLSVTGDAVGQLQHGKTRFSSFDFIPEPVVASFANMVGVPPDLLREDFDFEFKDELYVDNAFATAFAGNASVRIGRQQLPWGSGYAWNPTDIFHDKNFLDPTYEKRGVDAFKGVVPLSEMGSVTVVIGLDNLWDNAKKAIRFRSHYAGFDYSFSLMHDHTEEIDFLTGLTTDITRRYIAADFSGSIGEFGLWSEAAYVSIPDRQDCLMALVGADHTTEAGWYLSGEYYHNGLGASRRSDFTFNRWMRLIGEAGENLGRHYVFVGQTYPLSDLLTASSYAVVSLTDRSLVVYPYLEYSLSDNAVLTLIGYAPFGSETSEFGAFGWGGIVRGRYYF